MMKVGYDQLRKQKRIRLKTEKEETLPWLSNNDARKMMAGLMMGSCSKTFTVLYFVYFSHSLLFMERLKMVTVNINWARDREKQATVIELSYRKHIDWGMDWPGTHLSAGVAMIFSPHLRLTEVSICDTEQGRIQVSGADVWADLCSSVRTTITAAAVE